MSSLITLSTTYLASKIMKNALRSQLNITHFNRFTPRAKPQNKEYLLYIHVPFCSTFCTYCSFHKFIYNEEKAKIYFKHLRDEIRKVKDEGFKINCVYVGGGTTLINEKELIKTLQLVKELFNVDDISCESDPNHIENLHDFKGLITRLSVGVQSFDDDILKQMGRYTKYGDAKSLRQKLEKIVGILPITSLDLIFNIPSQDSSILRNDLQIAKQINPEQITTYPLMVSNITRKSIEKNLGNLDKKRGSEYGYYEIILDELSAYFQNNSWSFSKIQTPMNDEYGGDHNEYVGVGSGAFSFLANTLYVNTYNLDEYAQNIQNHGSSYMAYCTFNQTDKIRYRFLNALFNTKVDLTLFSKSNGIDARRVLSKEIKMLRLARAVEIKGDVIETNRRGKYLCLVMMREFYSGMDRVRAMFKEELV